MKRKIEAADIGVYRKNTEGKKKSRVGVRKSGRESKNWDLLKGYKEQRMMFIRTREKTDIGVYRKHTNGKSCSS